MQVFNELNMGAVNVVTSLFKANNYAHVIMLLYYLYYSELNIILAILNKI